MTKTKVTVGVCALNEEQNISGLIKSVLSQYQTNFEIEKILIISDGSSDSTANIARGINSKKIEVLEYGERRGQSMRLNEVYRSLKSDILVKFDADVVLADRYVISILIKPLINDDTVGMVCGKGIPYTPTTFIEKAVGVTRDTYKALKKNIHNGDNKMSVNGRIMAVRKEFIKNVYIPADVVGNDAYVYFSCLQAGLKFKCVESAGVYFHFPNTLKDHIKQNTRFVAVPAKMTKYFPKRLVDAENHIPFHLLMYYMIKQFIRHPILSISIFIINRYCQIRAKMMRKKLTGKWEISTSTKSFIRQMNKQFQVPTITIGIPAYNEEANISYLLSDLKKQNSQTYDLEKIIINSDGSTDKTAEIIRAIVSKKIILIDNKDNKGVARRQNEILKMCTSDILVILNADIRISDPQFIERLVRPIAEGFAELSSPKLIEFTPGTFFESVLVAGAKLRHELFVSWKGGQNGFLCHGGVRAFSRKFYTKLYFKDGGGEDMYSYLTCLSLNFRFHYVNGTTAFIRHPRNFRDHFKQSLRFFRYQDKLAHQFSKKIVNSELIIPPAAYIRGAISAIPIVLHFPVHIALYLLVALYMKVRSYFSIQDRDLWNASSTKSRLDINI